ncbi:MAG TPA: hypothetical protein VIH58_04945, partial [Chthoniobacterales bacterium]
MDPPALLEVLELFDLTPLLEELVFFLELVLSSYVLSVSLAALAVFDFPFDSLSPLEAPSSFESEAVLCFAVPLCEAFPIFPWLP